MVENNPLIWCLILFSAIGLMEVFIMGFPWWAAIVGLIVGIIFGSVIQFATGRTDKN